MSASLASKVTEIKKPKPLPAPDSDFYKFAEDLPADELAIVKKVRAYMETNVAPIINKYWVEDSFPFELLPSFKELKHRWTRHERATAARAEAPCWSDWSRMDIARTDISFCTFHGVHTGLAMNTIYLVGTEEQKQKWLPPMARMEKIGCSGLTEPLVGSGTGGGLTDHGEAGRRHLDPQRSKALDRQRSVVRHLDHLGARRGRQPGQGLHRREQDDARLQRREDREQDRAEGRPERPDHAEGLPGARRESSPGRQRHVSRHRARAAWDASWQRVGVDGHPDGRL